MKKKFITSIAVLSFFFNACNEDVINLVPIGDTEGGYFQNETQFQEAIAGIYQKLCFFYAFWGDAARPISTVIQLPGDDITSVGGSALENFVQLNGGDGQVGRYYQVAYQLIGRANIVLQKIDEAGDNAYKSYPELKNRNKGEALFIRAYMHWGLWNVYGTAPIANKRIQSLEESLLPSSKGTELLDQAITDLTEAIELLPDSWDADNLGRVTKNAARGLRGKCLMFRGTVNKTNTDFTSALADFNAIQGRALTARYGDNFEGATDNNIESLFEYQAQGNTTTNAYLTMPPNWGNDGFAVIGEIGHYIGFFNQMPSWIGNRNYTATEPIKNAYEEGDPDGTTISTWRPEI